MGALFRRTIDQTVKTELLIFLTPTVADDETELATISEATHALHTIALEKLKDDPSYQRYIKVLPETAPEK
jgi:type II secretory pathway component GspD/PulD (secretin)